MGIGCSCCTWCQLLCGDKKNGARAYHPVSSDKALLPKLSSSKALPVVEFKARAAVPDFGAQFLRPVDSIRGDILDLLQLEPLSESDRANSAKFWSEIGRSEHAAIASFGLYAQQLLAVGAPMDMVREAFLAADEEMGHAALSFALAEGFANARCPVPTYEQHNLSVSPSFEALIRETVNHGSLEETLGALDAARKAHPATLDSATFAAAEIPSQDPIVQAVWARIAVDEAHHASFGWRVLQWALKADRNRALPIMQESLSLVLRDKRREGWPQEDLTLVSNIADFILSSSYSDILIPTGLPQTPIYQTVLHLISSSLQ